MINPVANPPPKMIAAANVMIKASPVVFARALHVGI
jgi:hypothetical protein